MKTVIYVTVVSISILFWSCVQKEDSINHFDKAWPQNTSQLRPLLEETGTYNLRLNDKNWKVYVKHYKRVVREHSKHRDLEEFKQVMLNSIVNESDLLTAGDVGRDDLRYLALELDQLRSAAYPMTNYFLLERLYHKSSPEYIRSEEFINLVENAYSKGSTHKINVVEPAIKSLINSDQSEAHKNRIKKDYELKYNYYLPQLKSLIELHESIQ